MIGAIGGIGLSLLITSRFPHTGIEDFAMIFILVGGGGGMVGAVLGAKIGGYGTKVVLIALSAALLAAILVSMVMTIVSGAWVHAKEFGCLICAIYGLAFGALSFPLAFAWLVIRTDRQMAAQQAELSRVRARARDLSKARDKRAP